VYPDGRVCISILHPPGEDPNGYELASERWTPVHTVLLLFNFYSILYCKLIDLQSGWIFSNWIVKLKVVTEDPPCVELFVFIWQWLDS
jgi:hypothetical protein